ncbi:MAG: hypothetical protein ACRDYD_00595 [Acidimicrobiales bacterium]
MAFFEWLRESSERYLLEAARRDVGRRYGARTPVIHEPGIVPALWRAAFVPAYRRLPWHWRLWVIRAMPGSHRQRWAPAPARHDPAV